MAKFLHTMNFFTTNRAHPCRIICSIVTYLCSLSYHLQLFAASFTIPSIAFRLRLLLFTAYRAIISVYTRLWANYRFNRINRPSIKFSQSFDENINDIVCHAFDCIVSGNGVFIKIIGDFFTQSCIVKFFVHLD